jgi:hypothetical protein
MWVEEWAADGEGKITILNTETQLPEQILKPELPPGGLKAVQAPTMLWEMTLPDSRTIQFDLSMVKKGTSPQGVCSSAAPEKGRSYAVRDFKRKADCP